MPQTLYDFFFGELSQNSPFERLFGHTRVFKATSCQNSTATLEVLRLVKSARLLRPVRKFLEIRLFPDKEWFVISTDKYFLD